MNLKTAVARAPQAQSFDSERITNTSAYTVWVCQACLQFVLDQKIAPEELLQLPFLGLWPSGSFLSKAQFEEAWAKNKNEIEGYKAASLIRLLSKLHLADKIAIFGIFIVKFFDHMFTYALKIGQ